MSDRRTIVIEGLSIECDARVLSLLRWDNGQSDLAYRLILRALSELGSELTMGRTHGGLQRELSRRVMARAVALYDEHVATHTAAASRERVAKLECEAAHENAKAEAIRAKRMGGQ